MTSGVVNESALTRENRAPDPSRLTDAPPDTVEPHEQGEHRGLREHRNQDERRGGRQTRSAEEQARTVGGEGGPDGHTRQQRRDAEYGDDDPDGASPQAQAHRQVRRDEDVQRRFPGTEAEHGEVNRTEQAPLAQITGTRCPTESPLSHAAG